MLGTELSASTYINMSVFPTCKIRIIDKEIEILKSSSTLWYSKLSVCDFKQHEKEIYTCSYSNSSQGV